jgi:Uma2 family endonuclease
MATKTALTWEQFLAAGKPDQRWEYVDGEVHFMSPAGGEHGLVISQIAVVAAAFSTAHPEWVSLATDVAFTMAGHNWRCPDWALVRKERFGPEGVTAAAVPFPPDVAFEVISPNDARSEIRRKQREYRENGVIQVWVDPEERQVEVISPTDGARTFGKGETAVIGELPGFELNFFALDKPRPES